MSNDDLRTAERDLAEARAAVEKDHDEGERINPSRNSGLAYVLAVMRVNRAKTVRADFTVHGSPAMELGRDELGTVITWLEELLDRRTAGDKT